NQRQTHMKLSKSYLGAMLALLLGSCTDMEENPVGILAPEGFFKTEKDVQTVIHGAYGKIAADDYWGRELAAAVLLRSDVADIGKRGTGPARVQINDFNWDAFNAMVTRFWPASDAIIGTANTAIE